jgi:hypothetical protein
MNDRSVSPADLEQLREEAIALLVQERLRSLSEDIGITPVPRDGAGYPLSWVQERLWVIQERDRDHRYNMSGALILEGRLSTEGLQRALAKAD